MAFGCFKELESNCEVKIDDFAGTTIVKTEQFSEDILTVTKDTLERVSDLDRQHSSR